MCFVDEVSDLTESSHGWLAKCEFGFGSSRELDLLSSDFISDCLNNLRSGVPLVSAAGRLACVAAVSFPFPNAREPEENFEEWQNTPSLLLPNFLARPRRAPSLARFSFACSISVPPEKGKESAATQATGRYAWYNYLTICLLLVQNLDFSLIGPKTKGT